MKSKINRVLLAGTGSGCGKTTVVCGLLKALADRGQKAASFKCGPDYIDPMFHSEIIGTKIEKSGFVSLLGRYGKISAVKRRSRF